MCMKNTSISSSIKGEFAPLDETEAIHIDITDNDLRQSRIAAYNVGQMVQQPDSDKKIPVNPKKFPTKAVDVIFPVKDLLVETYFDTQECKWDSDVKIGDQHFKLSPDQMGMFFKTSFYQNLLRKLSREWPLSDTFYRKLFAGLQQREMMVDSFPNIDEDNDHSMSNKDVDGDKKRDYTASGRKIVSFTDNLVTKKDAKFYCWPDLKKVYRWSTWKDWKKIKPLCRMRFYHNGIPYGLSLSTMGEEEDYRNRGFRGYDLTPPPVQWLTKEEMVSMMNLSLVNKFIKHCVEKITKFISMDPAEIMEKVNTPDNLTEDEIRKT